MESFAKSYGLGLWLVLLSSSCYSAPAIDGSTYTHPTDSSGASDGNVPAPISPVANPNTTAASSLTFKPSASWSNALVGSVWSNGDATPRYVADLNGDGKADVAAMDPDNTYLALSTGKAFAAPTSSPGDYPASRAWNSQDTMPRATGDVNGDGSADFVGFGGGVWIDAGTSGGLIANDTTWSDEFFGGDWTNDNLAPRFVADVNGDGKADVIGIDATGIHVALSTGSAFSASTLWSSDFISSKGWTSQDVTPRMMADFNGDGMADVVGYGPSGVNVALSTGKSFTTVTVSTEFVGGGWPAQVTTPRFAGDVDGDGKADLVGIDANGVHLAISTGTGAKLSTVAYQGFDPNSGWTSQNATPRFLADVDGDKKCDIVGFGATTIEVVLAP